MQSVGEVMSIGRTFRESLQKAFRSLEVGLNGFQPKITDTRPLDISKIGFPSAFRLIKIWKAFKEGYSIDELFDKTKIDPWFLNQLKLIADTNLNDSMNNNYMTYLNKMDFLIYRLQMPEMKKNQKLETFRLKNNIPTYKMVDTYVAEFQAKTPYWYSTYEEENEIIPFTENNNDFRW